MTISNNLDAGATTGTGIQISGVSKSFSLRGGKSLQALQDTDLHTDKGSFLALLGPSGCGKSTILRILAALEHPTTGSALVDGQTPDQLRSRSELGIAELPYAGHDLQSHPLETQDFVALLPPGPLAATTAHVTLAALARQPLITTPPGTSTRRQTDEAFAAHLSEAPETREEAVRG